MAIENVSQSAEEISFAEKELPTPNDVSDDTVVETIDATANSTIDVNNKYYTNENGERIGIATLSDVDPVKLEEWYGIFSNRRDIKRALDGNNKFATYREDAFTAAAQNILNNNNNTGVSNLQEWYLKFRLAVEKAFTKRSLTWPQAEIYNLWMKGIEDFVANNPKPKKTDEKSIAIKWSENV